MQPISRRSLLTTGAGLGAIAVGGSLLSGCSSSSSKSTAGGNGGNAGSGAAPAPAYQAPAGPKPDIVGDKQIPDTFFSYPANPTVSVLEKAGDGKPVTILTQTFSAVTAKPPTNTAWAHLNQEIGSDLDIQQIPSNDYVSKFQTSVAGGQLPDMFFIAEVADLPNLVKATCLDLSDHLSGDNIKKYPNLAAIPAECWEAGRYGGRLYGIPSPRGAMSSGVLYRRDDLLAQKGVKAEWKNFEEFFQLASQLNDPKGGRWATTIVPGQYIKNMLGIPNFWKLDGGQFKSWWTDPKMDQALEAQRRWAAAGLMNPDAFAKPNTKTWFTNGSAYFNPDAFSAWATYFASAPQGFDIDVCQIPGFDGNGDGHLWMSFPSYGRSAINKKAAGRVDTLLKVANYLAAPFGTKEYLDVKYGQAGSDYTLQGTDPVKTQQGAANAEIGVKYLADARMANYLPGHTDSAKKLDASIRKLVSTAYSNDAVYLYSAEAEKNFQDASKQFSALESDIVQGRKPVSDWKPAADKWWNEHGKKMADELMASAKEAGRA